MDTRHQNIMGLSIAVASGVLSVEQATDIVVCVDIHAKNVKSVLKDEELLEKVQSSFETIQVLSLARLKAVYDADDR